MTNTNMRKGFTMIELIFVIVIIGILAAVAIPKLAANKDDATASTCMHEFGQIVTEISGAYTKSRDFADWTNKGIADVTNITIGVGTTGTKGIQEANATIDGATFTYNCDGEAMATLTAGANAAGDYQLNVAVQDTTASAPANIKATGELVRQYGSNAKIFTF